MSTRPPKGTTQMATRNPPTIDSTDTQLPFVDDDATRVRRRYDRGESVAKIATVLDLEPKTVAAHLRTTGDLPAIDDPMALAHLYDRFDSLAGVRNALDDCVCEETIRSRMEAFDIDRNQSLADTIRNADIDMEALGLSEPTDGEWSRPGTDEPEGQQKLDAFAGGRSA